MTNPRRYFSSFDVFRLRADLYILSYKYLQVLNNRAARPSTVSVPRRNTAVRSDVEGEDHYVTDEGGAEGRLIKTALLGGHPGGRLRVNLSSRAADADVYDSSTCNLYYTLFRSRTRRRRMHMRNIVMIASCVFRY